MTTALAQAPAIPTPPLTRVAKVGQSLSIAVNVTGALPLAFQWRHNGKLLAESGTTLALANIGMAHAGWYHVSATNAAGSATSVFYLHVAPVNGTVVAWGSAENNRTAVPAGLSQVVGVHAGYAHSLAVTSAGTVVAWGDNSGGQCNVPPAFPVSWRSRADGGKATRSEVTARWSAGEKTPTGS